MTSVETGPTTAEVAIAVRRVEETRGAADSADAYVTTLEELSGLLLEDASLEHLLANVLELTSRALSTSAAVSVTVVDDDGGYRTAAASHDEAVAVDHLQYELREGPCIDSLETGRSHLLHDLQEGPWPRFRTQARSHGFRSVLSLPLLAGGVSVGALNVFSRDAGGFGDDDIDLARRIAAPAATSLANARAYRRVTRLAGQLQEAMTHRSVIEQAKGVLIAQRRCDAETAFDLLRELSQHTNRKLRDVAAMLVAHAAAAPAAAGAGVVPPAASMVPTDADPPVPA